MRCETKKETSEKVEDGVNSRKQNRFNEMVAEDARIVAAEWREMGIEDARTMLAMTRESTIKGEELPEPAEQAKNRLRSYLHSQDIEKAWT